MVISRLPNAVLNVGILRSSAIGDVVLATGCLDLLDRLKVPVGVTWVGLPPSLPIVEQAWPGVKGVEVRGRDVAGLEKVLPELRGLDLLVDLQTNLRSHLIAHTLKTEFGIPSYACRKNTIGRSGMVMKARMRGRRRSLPGGLVHTSFRAHRMMSDCLRRALGIHLDKEALAEILAYDPVPRLPFPPDDPSGRPTWLKELKFGNWMAIAPGAAHPAKQAPTSLFRSILGKLRAQLQEAGSGPGPGLVFLGSEQERPLALEIYDAIDWPWPVLNLAGKLSLVESARALAAAGLYLGNDTGLAHISEAVGRPAGVIFGPTVEAFGFAPWRAGSRTFSTDLGCRPCSKHGKVGCRFGDHQCMTAIDQDQVVQWVLGQLAGQAKEASR